MCITKGDKKVGPKTGAALRQVRLKGLRRRLPGDLRAWFRLRKPRARRTRRVQLLSRRRTRAISGRHLLRSTLTASKGKGIVHFNWKLDSRASEANTYKRSDCVKQQADLVAGLDRGRCHSICCLNVSKWQTQTLICCSNSTVSGIIDRRLSLKQM